MLYIINLTVYLIWMVAVIYKKRFSWHSIVSAYAISVLIIDVLEVLINLLLGRYKFPTHLISNPVYDNQLGIIFADTLILPFAYIIFVHYHKKNYPWRTVIPFTLGFVILEIIYLHLGYLQYNNWKTIYSGVIYLAAFSLGAFLAPRIVSYNPPVPYSLRMLGFAYTVNMWVGALFGLPVLKLYQFKTGLFSNFMADDRFVDLYSGIALAIMCAVVVEKVNIHLRTLLFAVIAFIGVSFAIYSYYKGWLIYHNWNHFWTVFRYFVPFVLIVLYDRWESAYQRHIVRD